MSDPIEAAAQALVAEEWFAHGPRRAKKSAQIAIAAWLETVGVSRAHLEAIGEWHLADAIRAVEQAASQSQIQ